jgi:hypothetical protein
MSKPFSPNTLSRQSRNLSGLLKLGSWNVRTKMCPGVALCDVMKDTKNSTHIQRIKQTKPKLVVNSQRFESPSRPV